MFPLYYTILMSFTSGMAMAAMLFCCLYIFINKPRYRFQYTFGILTMLWAFLFMGNLFVALCEASTRLTYINTVMLTVDYWIVGGLMLFVVELLLPNRLKLFNQLLFLVPYIFFTVLYLVTGNDTVYYVENYVTLVLCVVLYVLMEMRISDYSRKLIDNVSNIDRLDLRWVAKVLRLMMVCLMLWLIESLSQFRIFHNQSVQILNVAVDVMYNLSVSTIVIFISLKLVRQEIYNEDAANEADPVSQIVKKGMFSNLDEIIREKEYYLDKNLSLVSLATLLGTNRQYLSNYINQGLRLNFYDYINGLRVERAEEIISKAEGNINMEDVAEMSGFNSYSTFRRFFSKKNGVSPSRFKKA